MDCYDWTNPRPEAMSADERRAYYALKRISSRLRDPGFWPDGKVWTEAQIVEALASEPIKKSCCNGRKFTTLQGIFAQGGR